MTILNFTRIFDLNVNQAHNLQLVFLNSSTVMQTVYSQIIMCVCFENILLLLVLDFKFCCDVHYNVLFILTSICFVKGSCFICI